MRRFALVLALSLALPAAWAFQWEPFAFPEGDQHYTLEVRSVGGGEAAPASVIDIVIRDTGGSYTVETTMTFVQEGVSSDDLANAAFGGSMLGTFMFGPMMLFGPTFMMLPLMLGQEDIRVRPEPMLVMGMGRLTMDRSETVAGRECVVLTFTPNDGEPFEFALAEGLPFPCYSRYDSGDGMMEIRLVRAD
jgi:hypothetical protein